ncbi:MAG: Stf0 family sulfotransferase [Caulobacteraceae bacterium]
MNVSASPIGRRLYWQRLAAIERQIAGRLKVDPDVNPFRGLKRRFVVAHAPRVGSHLLCQGLLAHGAVVEEFFEVARIHNVSARKGFSKLQQYCAWVLATYAQGGMFGVSGGVKALAPLAMTKEIPAFVSAWRFVHLTRQDIVRQAVSELIARRTGAFKSSKSPAGVLAADAYDPQRLKRLIDAALTVNAAWEGAFEVHGIEPLRLTYEALAADPPAVAATAAAFLGLDGPRVTEAAFLSPPLQRQATRLNDEWASRFREENPAFCASREAADFRPQQVRGVK